MSSSEKPAEPSQTEQTPATPVRRNEKAGILNFSKEMISALLMALVAIVYVIQAFRIPTGSMEQSLMIGDFLLGLKFMYGSPVLPLPNTYLKFPGITDPKPGDVIIFKYPGFDRKDYIKRCVAGPGQTIEIRGTQVIVDDRELILPPKGQYIRNGNLIDNQITNFAPLRIPCRGDTLKPADMPVRDFLFFKHLVEQENPRARVAVQYQLYLDGNLANDQPFNFYGRTMTMEQLHGRNQIVMAVMKNRQIHFDLNIIDDWSDLNRIFSDIVTQFEGRTPQIRSVLYLNGTLVNAYGVKYDNYFMMGDNRDNSKDSRYWGYLNRNFIKAKAFILYFSVDLVKRDSNGIPYYNANQMPRTIPFYHFPLHIRWDRIGKLIRSFHRTGDQVAPLPTLPAAGDSPAPAIAPDQPVPAVPAG